MFFFCVLLFFFFHENFVKSACNQDRNLGEFEIHLDRVIVFGYFFIYLLLPPGTVKSTDYSLFYVHLICGTRSLSFLEYLRYFPPWSCLNVSDFADNSVTIL